MRVWIVTKGPYSDCREVIAAFSSCKKALAVYGDLIDLEWEPGEIYWSLAVVFLDPERQPTDHQE